MSARSLHPMSVLLAYLAVFVVMPAGCKGRDDELSHFQKKEQEKEEAMEALRAKGAKFADESYPAYSETEKGLAINLSGGQISDEDFGHMTKLGRKITNLNLSKSNVSNAHLARINELGIGNLLVKLDLSHTAVSDEGLASLENLFVLRVLNVSGTKVTPAGIQRMRDARVANPLIKAEFKSPTITH